jgi:putative PIN family toxin of toxin-antitoxin system
MSRLRVVLDSSVLVAALRSQRGASFRIVELLRQKRFEIALSVALALEYEEVLVRHAAELGVSRFEIGALVDDLCRLAHPQEIHFLWRPTLADPGDEFILELAVAADCDAIVTHNVRHFGGAATFGLKVMTPGSILSVLEEHL